MQSTKGCEYQKDIFLQEERWMEDGMVNNKQTINLGIISYLSPCAKEWAIKRQNFTYTASANSQNNPKKEVLFSCPVYRWGNENPRQVKKLKMLYI